MHLARLFRHFAGLKVEQVLLEPDAIRFTVQRTATTAICPTCRRRSRRAHSRYERHLRDEPVGGRRVTIRWRVRRFRCANRRCSRRTFAEQIPRLASPHAQHSTPLRTSWQAIGLALGGRPGHRLCERLLRPSSRMTLLRLVQQLPLPDTPTPTFLGVDDWAQRKRHTYGALLVDHQRQRVVDLLPDRTAETLAAWLQAHPGVEIVTRDRAGAFAEGIRRGAPAAEQVADAFHVSVNLRDTLERIVQRHPEAVRAAGDEVAPAPPAPAADAPGVRRLTAPERQQQERRARRMARYAAVQQLRRQGIGRREIGRRLHLARKTVRTFARAATFPERQPRRRRPTALTPFEPYLHQRWAQGCHTATVLYQEVRARGFRGSYSAFAGHLKRWREAPGAEATRLPPRPKPLSARQVSWLLLRRDDELTADERAQREAVLRHSPELRTAADLAQRFRPMVRDRAASRLTPWLLAAERSDSSEWRGFARSLRLDNAAIRAMLRVPWSNGRTEGAINKLKLLKRSMVGRASLPLLKRRLLLAV